MVSPFHTFFNILHPTRHPRYGRGTLPSTDSALQPSVFHLLHVDFETNTSTCLRQYSRSSTTHASPMFLVTKFTWLTSGRDTTKCRRTATSTKHIANWREHPGSSNHDSEQNPHSTLRFAVNETSIPKNKSTGNLLSHASSSAMAIDTVRPRMSFDAGSLDRIARCVKQRIFPRSKAIH